MIQGFPNSVCTKPDQVATWCDPLNAFWWQGIWTSKWLKDHPERYDWIIYIYICWYRIRFYSSKWNIHDAMGKNKDTIILLFLPTTPLSWFSKKHGACVGQRKEPHDLLKKNKILKPWKPNDPLLSLFKVPQSLAVSVLLLLPQQVDSLEAVAEIEQAEKVRAALSEYFSFGPSKG